MKATGVILSLAVLGTMTWTACTRAQAYTDLETGRTVHLVEDPETGMMLDRTTRQPVYLYVNTRTKDTIFGPTGEVVNGKLTRSVYDNRESNNDNRYFYVYEDGLENEAYAMKLKSDDGEYKYKRERDGDYKIKRGDESKIKYQNGEYKVKRPGYKYERERDGDITIKEGNRKIKIDGETGERKVKYDD